MKKLLLILPMVFLFCFTFGCQEQAEEGITNEQVNALIDEHLKIWNERNIALVDKCFSQDCVFENPVSHGPRVGSEAFKNQLSYEFKALSDINLKLKDVFIKDDKIALILTWTATHSGPLVLPTGTIPVLAQATVVTEPETTKTSLHGSEFSKTWKTTKKGLPLP